MAANTPADQRRSAAWMSNDELTRAAEALFSFESKNERDESARLALVRELADRGIDPRTLGYKGARVVLNPNPKQDPVAKAAETAQRAVDTARRKIEVVADRQKREAASTARKNESAAKAKQREEDEAKAEAEEAQAEAEAAEAERVEQRLRTEEGDALARGALTEIEVAERRRDRGQR